MTNRPSITADIDLLVTISRTVPLLSTRIMRSPVERRWKKLNGSETMWSRKPSVIRVSSAMRRWSRRKPRTTSEMRLNAVMPPIVARQT